MLAEGSSPPQSGLPGGVALLELPTGAVLHTSRLRETVTALAWSAHTLYAGGSGGGVAVLEITAAADDVSPVSVAAPRQILALDSRVVQLQADSDLLGIRPIAIFQLLTFLVRLNFLPQKHVMETPFLSFWDFTVYIFVATASTSNP